jgi:hypothetical protein
MDDHQYHQLAFEDLPQSYFPCLDSKPGISRAWQSTEVPFRDAVRLRKFCEQYNASSLSFFQAAWALVLRCYLGNPSVCFVCSSSETHEAEVVSGVAPSISVHHVDFGAMTSLLDVLKGAHKTRFQPSSHQSSIGHDILPINTTLVYREARGRDWYGAIRPVNQCYADDSRRDVSIVIYCSLHLLPLVC